MNNIEHVTLDQERCKGCNLCIDVCPNSLFEAGNTPNQAGFYPVKMIDADFCINCMRCVDICPDRALIPPERKRINWSGLIYWTSQHITRRILKSP